MGIIDSFAAGGMALASCYLGFVFISDVVRFRRLRELEDKEKERFNAQIQVLLEERAKVQSMVNTWNGWRKFRVAEKVDEGGDICSFYLKPHDEKSIPGFKPGQYLTFQLNIPGQPKPVIRCYSLSDYPKPDHYRVSIKRVPPPRNKPHLPPGLSSNYFHDKVSAGDILDVKAPSGHFFFNTAPHRPVVLIGGGIGLTPVLSMFRQLSLSPEGRKITFFYGVRNSKEHVLRSEMQEAVAGNSDIDLVVCYSDPLPEDVKGRDYDIHGRVSVELFKKQFDVNNYDFYVCGPPPMMSSITKDLKLWGVPDKHVHFETFGPSTIKKTQPPIKIDTSSSTKVFFKKADISAPWKGDCGSILELAENAGVTIPSGCRAGNCGTCNVAVNKGKFKHLQEPGFEPDDGTCLACIAVPDGDVTIDA